jgi:predicted nucleotidyltransferase/HEPN domain-containing protein
MKSDLDHLPHKQQDELALIRTTLLNGFEAALTSGGGGTQPWRRNGKILKIILFGSYARNDWVDEPLNGYQSDFDLLVIVNHENLTDIADYWWAAEDRLLRDPAVDRTVNIIVHTLAEVNQFLERGEYFWTDIQRDGVKLYELPGHPLATPRLKTPLEAAGMAERYYSAKLPDLDRWIATGGFQIAEALKDSGFRKLAAFSLHQAVESAYICYLLVSTLYAPRSHNIRFLRSLAEGGDQSLAEVWPREQRVDRRRFELLKRAYVEARYSAQYDVSADDLTSLMATARDLRDRVAAACEARIKSLREPAGQ